MSKDVAKVKSGEIEKPRQSVKNQLQGRFINDLYEEWKLHGAGAIRIMRDEKPAEFVKMVASLMPKEVELDLATYVARVPVNVTDLDQWPEQNKDLITNQR